MPNLDEFKKTRIADGNVTNALRTEIEGVFLDNSVYFDTDSAADTLTPIQGRVNPFVVNDALWMQDAPGHPRPGGLDSRVWYVVSKNGESMQVSTTQGGQPQDITSDSRTVMSNLIADYRKAVNEEVLLALKTNLTQELTNEELVELVDMIAVWLLTKKAEKDGVL